MEKEIRCYKCGRAYHPQNRKLKQVITCRNCQSMMKLGPASEQKLKVVRGIFVGVVALILVYAMSLGDTSLGLLVLVAVASLCLILARVADEACLWITHKLFGLEYIEYHPKNAHGQKPKKRRR